MSIYANETMKLLLNRASSRIFEDKAISDEVVNAILEAGVHAPSAGNLQPFSIIKIIKDEDKKFLTENCEMQSFVAHAPLNLLFCMDFYRLEQWAKVNKAPFSVNHSFRHFWVIFQDVVIAAQSICTAADSYGLGSCYIGTTIDYNAKIVEYFKLPKKVMPVVLLSIGYPKGKKVPNVKHSVQDIVHEDFYHIPTDEEIKAMYDKKYDHHHMPLNERNKKLIYDVAYQVHGEDYANEVVEEMEKNGYINYAQYRFGLHYVASTMTEGKEEFIKEFKDQEIDGLF